MTMQFRDLAAQVAADGFASDEEILELRRASWADGGIDISEADALFAANDRIGEASAQWVDYFVEAVGEFVVNRLEPRGYVTPEQADWLIAHIDRDGRIDSLCELELLVSILERAESAPESLRIYALRQIEQAVLTGTGPTRNGGELQAGTICAAEVQLIRRVIFASGSESPAAVSRAEADMLFSIKDAALGCANAPEWKRLFVQGVGNYLMGFAGHEPLTRERAAELDSFMNDAHVSIGRFIGRMARANVNDGIRDVLSGREATVDPLGAFEDEARAGARVDSAESLWLDTHIQADGAIDEYEQALLDFIADTRRQD